MDVAVADSRDSCFSFLRCFQAWCRLALHRRYIFYSTTLDLLLKHLGAEALILAGFRADMCILFTANDAYMRDYRLMIPADCAASQDETENQRALKFMERVLKADIPPSKEIDPTTVSDVFNSHSKSP